MKRQAVAVLDRCDIEDDTGTTLQHAGENRPIEPCRRHQANIQLVLSMVIGKRQDASIERGRASHPLHDDVDSAPLLPVFLSPRSRHADATRGIDVRLDEVVRLLAIRKR